MATSNLLKGFGKAANVAGQLATDKALRRKATASPRGFDLSAGQLIENAVVGQVSHGLRRVPKGAQILRSSAATIFVSEVSLNTITLEGPAGGTATIWVV